MRRGWLVVLLGLALVACQGGGASAPFAETDTPAQLAARFYPPDGWTWGYVGLGDGPVQRYGVSAATTTAKADILILPDYGETAETWFETARDLNARGYAVWVLEGAGQGGSERMASPRDLGHITSFDPDVSAVRAMSRGVIRPSAQRPLILLGQGVGGLIAARAARAGADPAGLILSSPSLDPIGGPVPFSLFGPGAQRAPGQHEWRRSDAFAARLTHDRWRGGVTLAWQIANPDLRMGGHSTGWRLAYDAAVGRARPILRDLGAPTLVLEGAAAKGCREMSRCQAQRWPAADRALELESDTTRGPWLAAIDTFVRAQLPAPAAR